VKRKNRDADDGNSGVRPIGYVDPVDPLLRTLDVTLDWLTRLFDGIKPNPRPPVTDVIDLEDVVRYFTEKHPGDPRIVAGALLRRPHPRGHLLYQVFLDNADHICLDDTGKPYGQRLVARSLGRELGDKFSPGNDLVIFR
jgi:hypothetical protein